MSARAWRARREGARSAQARAERAWAKALARASREPRQHVRILR